MTSERIQRRINSLLDEADDAVAKLDWATVRDRASAVLAADPENADGKAYLDMAERGLASVEPQLGTGSTSASSSPPPTERTQPTSFAGGRYTVSKFLGEGGKKRVYLAHDAQLDRDVAFALIKTEGLDEAARVRITREAQAMGRLGSHPHIVTVYDIGEENGQPYLVLPVLPGGDVEGVIEDAEDHKLSIEQAIKIAIETCLGLEFSHAKGIIHRDLKPGNVWLAEDGRAMIGDFGLAIAVDRSRLTQAGMMVGTVNYMPPEQAMGGEVTPRSDLYSLGAMLYEMVCGRPPFVGDESVAIIGQHLNTPPVAPTWHRPDCPPGLEALILRLLEKDASKRPDTATEVREALSNIGQAAPVSKEAPAPAEPAVDPLYRRTFVGRENETRQLHQAYDAAVSGQGGLVMIAGEPGIGKTALCDQLETYVSLRGGKTLFGHCYEEGSLSLPYLAFVEAMRTYVLDRDPEGLKSDLGTGAADVARIVSEVRDRVDVAMSEPSSPEDDRWRLLNAITTFLQNAAQVQPLVIMLEDLHWADRGTLDLLLHVARNLEGARLLVVGTYRDVEVDRTHPLSATLADLRRINTFLRIPLRGLTVDEVHRMYEAIRGNTVPRGQAEAVHRATEGNPLFVQEILRYLVEEGLVVRQDGQYVGAGVGVGIPEGLRDVVGRRLGHLSERANQVLSIASVIGRDFRLDVLQEVSGLPEAEVQEALEDATERSIIEQRQTVGSLVFRFSHAFFRQVLYEEIFAARQIRWHQQVARALEKVYGVRTAEHATELADHYSHSTDANDLQKAVEYGYEAAQRAMSVFAYGEAVGQVEQSIKAQEVLDPEDKERLCDLYLALGEALLPASESGGPRRAMEYAAPQALRLAEELTDDHRAFAACRIALDAENLFQGGMASAEWLQWIERAERYSRSDPSARVRYCRSKAVALGLLGDFSNSLTITEEGMRLAREHGTPDAQFMIASQLMSRNFVPVRVEMPIQLADEFARRPRTNISTFVLSAYLIGAFTHYLAIGDRVQIDHSYRELHGLAERTKHPHAAFVANRARATLSILSGNLEEALDELAEGGDHEGASSGRVTTSGLTFSPATWLGRTSTLEQPRSEAPSFRPLHALVLAHIGQLEDANSILSDYMSDAQPKDLLPLWALTSLLDVSIMVNDRAATGVFVEVLAQANERFEPWTCVCVARLVGDARSLLGDLNDARDSFQQAVKLCESVGYRPELSLTRAHLAELLLDHYPDERDAAIEHLDFAIAEFRDMKMQPALERALGRRGLLKA